MYGTQWDSKSILRGWKQSFLTLHPHGELFITNLCLTLANGQKCEHTNRNEHITIDLQVQLGGYITPWLSTKPHHYLFQEQLWLLADKKKTFFVERGSPTTWSDIMRKKYRCYHINISRTKIVRIVRIINTVLRFPDKKIIG